MFQVAVYLQVQVKSSLDIAPLTILDSGVYNLGSCSWLALAVVS